MCSIVGSFDFLQVKRLVQASLSRGQYAHALFILDAKNAKVLYQHRGMGPLDWQQHKEIPDGYMLCHHQAPTGKKRGLDNIHPAYKKDGSVNHWLWHNGLLKAKTIKPNQWDTSILLQNLIETGTVDNIDGSMACFYHQYDNCNNSTTSSGKMMVFRNHLAPLFIDDSGTVSSIEFTGSKPLPPEQFFMWQQGAWQSIKKFKTYHNPYYGL